MNKYFLRPLAFIIFFFITTVAYSHEKFCTARNDHHCGECIITMSPGVLAGILDDEGNCYPC